MARIEDEFAPVYNAWKTDPTPETSYALASALKPYISHAIISAGGDPNDKVLQAKANMMAIALMNRYDPEKSTMQNFLYANLRGLSRVVGEAQNIIPVTEYTVLGKKAIAKAEQELTDSLGRFPTTEEIADKTGISAKTIRSWKKADLPVTQSTLDAAVEGQSYAGSKIIDRTPADDAWYEYVYDSLSPRKQSVMERLYGLHGYEPRKQVDVAKELGISSVAVNKQKKEIDSLIYDDARYSLFED